jgi:hypothetical protein
MRLKELFMSFRLVGERHYVNSSDEERLKKNDNQADIGYSLHVE